MIDLYTALTIGLIGSLHCIGMCGPIALALPVGSKAWPGKVTGTLLYNIGRSITYGVLGALFGLLGKGIYLAGFQQWASILIGIIMILSILLPWMSHKNSRFERLINSYSAKLSLLFSKRFGHAAMHNLFLIGLLNGLLPCGLVYVAVAGALNTHDVVNGILFMLVFGLGTIPVMMGITLAGHAIGGRLRARLSAIVKPMVIVLGILFILRGLSLGIPYISPKTEKLTPVKEVKVEGSCCTPAK